MNSSVTNNIAIRDWTDAYVALKAQAEASRGMAESTLLVGEKQRWPRTTGADVLCIASLIDPCVRSLVESDCFGAASVAHLWHLSLRDLERWAMPALDREYIDNRRFWDDLLTILVNLALSAKALQTLPPQREWEDLFEALRTPPPTRNGVPKDAPFGPFLRVEDFGDLFIKQRNALAALRGSDVKAPEPGMPGTSTVIPRSTYEDVRVLREFWSRIFKNVKEIDGRAGVTKLWEQAIEEHKTLWKDDRKNELYPQNNMFWRALFRLSTHVNVAEEAPSRWERAKESTGTAVEALPQTLHDAGKAAYGGAKSVASGVADFVLGFPGRIGSALNTMSFGFLRGLFGPVGPYLVIGGGVVAGYLLLRRPDGKVVMVPTSRGRR